MLSVHDGRLRVIKGYRPVSYFRTLGTLEVKSGTTREASQGDHWAYTLPKKVENLMALC